MKWRLYAHLLEEREDLGGGGFAAMEAALRLVVEARQEVDGDGVEGAGAGAQDAGDAAEAGVLAERGGKGSGGAQGAEPFEAEKAGGFTAATLPDAQGLIVGAIAVAKVLRAVVEGADEFDHGETQFSIGIDHQLSGDDTAQGLTLEAHGAGHAADETDDLAMLFEDEGGEVGLEPGVFEEDFAEVALEAFWGGRTLVAETAHPQGGYLIEIASDEGADAGAVI